jgi:UDP-2,3-diacylglucosamine pyrophosphatase LpxH
MSPRKPKTRYRTVWISDLHLGTKACRVEPLLDFLSSIQCEYLFLVGDVVDLWALKRKWYWPGSHNDVIRKILKRSSKGAHVIYIPGNHDETFRSFIGLTFGGVEIKREAFHATADGRKILMLHGDEFDHVVTHHQFLTAFGDVCYDVLLWLTRGYHWLRRKFGWRYFSLAAYVKHKVKYICQFVSNYHESLIRYAKSKEADIVITGHIHRPEIVPMEGITYANCGDWVENCAALVEHLDGRLEIIHAERDGHGDAPQAVAPAEEPEEVAV